MIHFSYIKHKLEFNFDARTSRGEIKSHDAYIIIAKNSKNERIGLGEAAPLKGLSIDHIPDFESNLQFFIEELNNGKKPDDLNLEFFPAVRFAVESALLGLNFDERERYFNCDWLNAKPIPINGLVWMNESEAMLKEAVAKAEKGFDCIKFKIGALDFDEECRLLERFRKLFAAHKVQIRLDANGAFLPDECLLKLNELKRFELHSIEQPIQAKQWDIFQEIIAKSPIDIALDEELIGLNPFEVGKKAMDFLKPHYLILKPTLIGGLKVADEWVKLAENEGKKWWATSALESNIGLNIIAQWCSSKNTALPQGLGTGSLYSNNFVAPFKAENGFLSYISNENWKLPNHWFIAN